MTATSDREEREPEQERFKDNLESNRLSTKDKVWVGIAIAIFVILFVIILVFGIY